MDHDILKPMVVLVAWTLVMCAWMIATRLPAMKAAGADLSTMVGAKASDADKALPAKVQWIAHNYNHLLEQPVAFYAIAVVLALTGTGTGFNMVLAWAYVGLRIAHSIVQATSNRVSIRFAFFALSTLCLAAMTLHAAIAVFH